MESITQESQPKDNISKKINNRRLSGDIVGGVSLMILGCASLIAFYGFIAFITKEFWPQSQYRVINQQGQELAREMKRKQELTRKLFGYKTDTGFQIGYADRDSNHVVTLKEAIDAWERMGIPIPGEISVDEEHGYDINLIKTGRYLPYPTSKNLERAVQSYETEHQSQQRSK